MRLRSSAGIAGTICLGIALVCLVWFMLAGGFNFLPLLFAVTFAGGGLVCLVPAAIYGARLGRLKRGGFCYPAQIVQSVKASRPSPAILRIGGSADTVFVCAYKDEQGKSREVFSRRLYSGADAEESLKMKAVVYVDKNNPKRYAVEVFDGS